MQGMTQGRQKGWWVVAKKGKKPNCYDCEHRGTLAGDAHSRCLHPKTGIKASDNEFGSLVGLFGGSGANAWGELGITGNKQGIKGGSFMWPANYDPVWLESCNGFAAKKKPKK